MSDATTAASVDGGDDGMTAAAVPPVLAEANGMRGWAEALVDRARSEGVSLTGEGGLLTSMVRGAADRVLPDMVAWQSRPLDRVYPVLLTCAIRREGPRQPGR